MTEVITYRPHSALRWSARILGVLLIVVGTWSSVEVAGTCDVTASRPASSGCGGFGLIAYMGLLAVGVLVYGGSFRRLSNHQLRSPLMDALISLPPATFLLSTWTAASSLSRWSQNLPLAFTLMGLIALAGTVGLSLLLHRYPVDKTVMNTVPVDR
ncbi:hypothetical protein CVS30_04725 [Arthrobacter psychrolactophilus]|uniref:Uncharacterized protein n=1 Tax=Arthrobacter psychrolactophilus TaxID=92442 RepID=A0A2V5JMG3_9MICC|nr:hypothetical protein CVS30_04725 [Arthrobacter psychrolactophilus]